jgi:MFS family permease
MPPCAALGMGATRGRTVVLLVCVGTFMTTLDASIVNIGLPSIARAFGAPLGGTTEWVIIGSAAGALTALARGRESAVSTDARATGAMP